MLLKTVQLSTSMLFFGQQLVFLFSVSLVVYSSSSKLEHFVLLADTKGRTKLCARMCVLKKINMSIHDEL
jgi:hypothetical protein